MPIIPPPPASGQLGFGHDAYLNGTATQLTSSDNEVIQGLIFLQSKAAEPGSSSGLPNLALHVILLVHKKPLDVMASGGFRQMSQAGPTPVEPAIQALEAERQELLRTSEEPYVAQVRQLLRLRGIGPQSAWLFVTEFFAWREFRNRRQVGALAGLAPTPYRSGDEDRELGISHAGPSSMRGMAIEIAWGWLHFQPESDLSQWYVKRFGEGSKRIRKMGIVALARKLLIALWHYLEDGVIPAGAQLKA